MKRTSSGGMGSARGSPAALLFALLTCFLALAFTHAHECIAGRAPRCGAPLVIPGTSTDQTKVGPHFHVAGRLLLEAVTDKSTADADNNVPSPAEAPAKAPTAEAASPAEAPSADAPEAEAEAPAPAPAAHAATVGTGYAGSTATSTQAASTYASASDYIRPGYAQGDQEQVPQQHTGVARGDQPEQHFGVAPGDGESTQERETALYYAHELAREHAKEDPHVQVPNLQDEDKTRGGSQAGYELNGQAVKVKDMAGAMLQVEAQRKEAATGIKFPRTLTVPGLDTELTLLGTGVREADLGLLTLKVYAVGFYLDVDGMKAWKGKSGVEIAEDPKFIAHLANAPVDKALLLTLDTTVSAKDLAQGMKENLRPRLEARGGDVALLDELQTLFGDKRHSKGQSLILGWQQPETLVVVDGLEGEGKTIVSQPLVEAIFDEYLGRGSITPALAKSVKHTISGAD